MEFKYHQHGKSKVRVGRVWRRGGVHHMVEWNVDITLYSSAEKSFESDDNSSVVATDTMKNTVYVIAKQCADIISPEEFAVRLGRHFCDTYSIVSGARIRIAEKPWQRAEVGGKPHNHGFKLGSESHTVDVTVTKGGEDQVAAGIEGLALLKTTQSGFEGFVRDGFTALQETRERIMATSATVNWSFSQKPRCYSAAFDEIKTSLLETFLGPASEGVYSPSVQNTLYLMAEAVLRRVPEVQDISLSMPNLHFIPQKIDPIGLKFNDDVYVATSEPHGTIEACLQRKKAGPSALHSRL